MTLTIGLRSPEPWPYSELVETIQNAVARHNLRKNESRKLPTVRYEKDVPNLRYLHPLFQHKIRGTVLTMMMDPATFEWLKYSYFTVKVVNNEYKNKLRMRSF